MSPQPKRQPIQCPQCRVACNAVVRRELGGLWLDCPTCGRVPWAAARDTSGVGARIALTCPSCDEVLPEMDLAEFTREGARCANCGAHVYVARGQRRPTFTPQRIPVRRAA